MTWSCFYSVGIVYWKMAASFNCLISPLSSASASLLPLALPLRSLSTNAHAASTCNHSPGLHSLLSLLTQKTLPHPSMVTTFTQQCPRDDQAILSLLVKSAFIDCKASLQWGGTTFLVPCVFFNKCLYFSQNMARYLWTDPVQSLDVCLCLHNVFVSTS